MILKPLIPHLISPYTQLAVDNMVSIVASLPYK